MSEWRDDEVRFARVHRLLEEEWLLEVQRRLCEVMHEHFKATVPGYEEFSLKFPDPPRTAGVRGDVE